MEFNLINHLSILLVRVKKETDRLFRDHTHTYIHKRKVLGRLCLNAKVFAIGPPCICITAVYFTIAFAEASPERPSGDAG